MRATTGMSSPPVASGSAAVGKAVRAWKARTRASEGGRTRLRAIKPMATVTTKNWMRASVRVASMRLWLETLVKLEKPKMTIPGR